LATNCLLLLDRHRALEKPCLIREERLLPDPSCWHQKWRLHLRFLLQLSFSVASLRERQHYYVAVVVAFASLCQVVSLPREEDNYSVPSAGRRRRRRIGFFFARLLSCGWVSFASVI
jgi:hypothetical protein